MEKIKTVAVIGLGKMGLPMSGHLLHKGFGVIGYDPAPEACAKAKALGARVAGSCGEAASQSELSLVVVGFDSQVESAVFGHGGIVEGARHGHIVAVCSTVAPRYAVSLAGRLAERGIVALDAPLTRGEAAAISGRLLILGAGDEHAFAACRPALEAFASPIHHLGAAGAGQVGKMVNNLILWACTSANDEGLRLGEALGVDRERMRKALHDSSAQNWSMDYRAEDSGMPWAEKDMHIVLDEADHARLSLPLCGTVKETIKGLKIRMGLAMPEEK
jgi:3-hydroxyisobutyrate dehydrogenase-like beta-hydroxyacid dehydrogenase